MSALLAGNRGSSPCLPLQATGSTRPSGASMYLYLIGAFDYNDALLAVKIGVTRDIGKRIAAMQTGQFCEMRLIVAWEVASRAKCFNVERGLHEHFSHRRMRGEWFRPMIVREFIPVACDLAGSVPCSIPSVPGCLKRVQDMDDTKRASRRRHAREKKARRASATAANPPHTVQITQNG